MGMKSRIFWALTISTLLILVTIQNAGALVEAKNLNKLITDSDDIIIGKVMSKESYWKDGNIFTNVTVSANQHIKGKSDSQFLVKIPGGTVGNIYAEVSDVPSFEDNENVLLFLKRNQIVGWNQGKYTIKDGKIKETGESMAKFVRRIVQNLSEPDKNLNYDIDEINIDEINIDEINIDEINIDEINIDEGTIDQKSTIIPHILNVTPGYGPSKAVELGSNIAASDSTKITITGSGFGSTSGNVKFWHEGTIQYYATIISWTDIEIVVKVPGRISSYTKPDGTGNLQVFTSSGRPSDNYGNFGVTYAYGGGKWSGNKTAYVINPNTISDTGVITALQAAANTWNNVGTNFEFIYGGTTSKTDAAMDGENSITWVNYETGSVAITTTYWFETNPKTIVESDIVFNGYDYDWGTDGSHTKMDIQTVATHELGHWLQLLDLYGYADNEKIMYGYVFNGEIKRNLSNNDIIGVKEIYGLSLSDKISPTTTLTGVVEGTAYKNSVKITLNATDNEGGSGIRDIGFSINDGAMIVYSAPFIVNNIGKNTITYRAIDNTGNFEQTKSVNFTINDGDILSHYRGLNKYPNILETNDLLKAADDWRNDIILQEYSAPLTTNQLLTLADEWRVS